MQLCAEGHDLPVVCHLPTIAVKGGNIAGRVYDGVLHVIGAEMGVLGGDMME